MRRSGTHNDFSQALQPQKKTVRRCYSETSLSSMNVDEYPENSQKPKHPLLGIPASVFMMPAKIRSKEILHYPKTPDRADSPKSSLIGSPNPAKQVVPTSPSQIPIPISKSLRAITKEAGPLIFSSSSESLSSMMEKSTIDTRARKIPQRTRSMENLQYGTSNNFLTTNKSPTPKAQPKTEKTKNSRKKRAGTKRRPGHNQRERSRALKIRTAISDIKKILEEAGVTVHREKVKILQSALAHMRHLKEVLGQCKQRHSNLCMRVQQFQQMEEARRQMSIQQRLNFASMSLHPMNVRRFNDMDPAAAARNSAKHRPMNNSVAPVGAVPPNAVQHQVPMDRMPRDVGMQMPGLLQQQQPHLQLHPGIMPRNYDVSHSMARPHRPHMSPHMGPHMSPHMGPHMSPHLSPHMSPHMAPVDVSGPDGMLDSMEPPLKFEEDETWDNAPSQEDPFMSFFPTGATADPTQLSFAPAGGADMPTIDADDMQLPDLMAMLDSGIPGQTRVTSSIDTFL